MKVTQILELNKSRSRIFIDEEPAFVLYKGEIGKYRIREGEEIPGDAHAEIMGELLPKRAKLRAMNLLKSRPYTAEEMKRKLRSGYYPESIIEEAIEYVSSYHYIDDLRYAEDYIFSYEGIKSKRRIESDLTVKGIDAQTLEEAWEHFEEKGGSINEEEMIGRLLKKRGFDAENTNIKEIQKTYAFLARKGFSGEAIRKSLKANFYLT